jgi:drug/metabolite transporter (DMT)-like permease
MPATDRPRLLPAASCLIAATLWGLIWYPLRQLEQMGVPGLWATLLIYLFALLPVLPLLGRAWSAVHAQPVLLPLIGLAAGWCNLAFILALLDGTVVRVLLLFYLSPVWTVLLGYFVLGERLSAAAWLTLALAMCGVGIMLWQPEFRLFMEFAAADALAISSGFAFAVNNVLVRKTGELPIVFKMTAAWIGVLLLVLPGLWLVQPPAPVISGTTLALMVAVGSLGMTTMTYTAQYGVTHLPVHRSAVLFLFEIVAGAISAWLLSDEIIQPREWLGGMLVIAAAWLSARPQAAGGSGTAVCRRRG